MAPDDFTDATERRRVAIPPTVAASADEITLLVRSGHHAPLFRCLIQISNNLGSVDLALRVALAVSPPALTGHSGADAFIAATVGRHLRGSNLACPAWVDEPERSSPTEWVADGHAENADLIRDDTPDEFRRRNVLVTADDLAVFG